MSKHNKTNAPLSIFLLVVAVSALAQSATADVFLEDYEVPPVQTGQYAGTSWDGDDYRGIFDDPAAPNDLRATWGEAGAGSIEVVAEDSNHFVRLYTDVSQAEDYPGFEGFVGILDHPSVEFFAYNLVGDFASLFEEPLYVGGLDISVDARLPADPGYPVYVRFLFTDIDGDEFVTRRFQVVPGAWQTIRIKGLSLEELILLPDTEGDGIWNGYTVFPVSVEVLIGAALPVSGIIHLDIDNFRAQTRCLKAILGDINNDCKVDFADFAIMALHWLECNLDPPSECWE